MFDLNGAHDGFQAQTSFLVAICETFSYEMCGTCEITFDDLIIWCETANSFASPMAACGFLMELSYLPGDVSLNVSLNQLSYTFPRLVNFRDST